MARRRAEQAPVGLTSNGILIVNILGLLDAREANRVKRALPAGYGKDWFVGMAVRKSEVTPLLSRLDDAAAEAVARIVSRNKTPASKRHKR